MSCESAIGSLSTKVPPAMNLSEPQNFLVCVDRIPRSRVALAWEFGSWFEGDEEDEHRAIRHPSAVIDSDRYGRARAATRVAPTLDRKAEP